MDTDLSDKKIRQVQANLAPAPLSYGPIGASLPPLKKEPINRSCRWCGQAGRSYTKSGNLCDRCYEAQKAMERAEEIDRAWLRFAPEKYQNAKMVDLSQPLRDAINRTTGGILFWGLPGRGKTYAAFAIMRTWIEKDIIPVRVRYRDMCLRIRSSYAPKATETEYDILKEYRSKQVLWIEDIGSMTGVSEQEGNFSNQTLLSVLDHRHDHCLPLYLTTNKSPDELGKSFDERIASRLKVVCSVIALTGEDKRVEQKGGE